MLGDWAFAIVISRLLAMKPRVTKQNGNLVVVSGLRSILFTLGAYMRKVTVDPTNRLIRIQTRWFWFFTKSRVVLFDRVHDVLYSYADLSPGSALPMSSYQEQDLFTVGLLVDGREHLSLFRFYGQGSFVNNSVWPDWCYWDNFALSRITQTSQETESMLFAELLSVMIGVPVTNPLT